LSARYRPASRRRTARVSRRAEGAILDGISDTMVPRGGGGGRTTGLAASAAEAQDHSAAVRLADVFRKADSELDQAPATPLSPALRVAHSSGTPAGAGLCASLYPPARARRRSRQRSPGARDR